MFHKPCLWLILPSSPSPRPALEPSPSRPPHSLLPARREHFPREGHFRVAPDWLWASELNFQPMKEGTGRDARKRHGNSPLPGAEKGLSPQEPWDRRGVATGPRWVGPGEKPGPKPPPR